MIMFILNKRKKNEEIGPGMNLKINIDNRENVNIDNREIKVKNVYNNCNPFSHCYPTDATTDATTSTDSADTCLSPKNLLIASNNLKQEFIKLTTASKIVTGNVSLMNEYDKIIKRSTKLSQKYNSEKDVKVLLSIRNDDNNSSKKLIDFFYNIAISAFKINETQTLSIIGKSPYIELSTESIESIENSKVSPLFCEKIKSYDYGTPFANLILELEPLVGIGSKPLPIPQNNEPIAKPITKPLSLDPSLPPDPSLPLDPSLSPGQSLPPDPSLSSGFIGSDNVDPEKLDPEKLDPKKLDPKKLDAEKLDPNIKGEAEELQKKAEKSFQDILDLKKEIEILNNEELNELLALANTRASEAKTKAMDVLTNIETPKIINNSQLKTLLQRGNEFLNKSNGFLNKSKEILKSIKNGLERSIDAADVAEEAETLLTNSINTSRMVTDLLGKEKLSEKFVEQLKNAGIEAEKANIKASDALIILNKILINPNESEFVKAKKMLEEADVSLSKSNELLKTVENKLDNEQSEKLKELKKEFLNNSSDFSKKVKRRIDSSQPETNDATEAQFKVLLKLYGEATEAQFKVNNVSSILETNDLNKNELKDKEKLLQELLVKENISLNKANVLLENMESVDVLKTETGPESYYENKKETEELKLEAERLLEVLNKSDRKPDIKSEAASFVQQAQTILNDQSYTDKDLAKELLKKTSQLLEDPLVKTPLSDQPIFKTNGRGLLKETELENKKKVHNVQTDKDLSFELKKEDPLVKPPILGGRSVTGGEEKVDGYTPLQTKLILETQPYSLLTKLAFEKAFFYVNNEKYNTGDLIGAIVTAKGGIQDLYNAFILSEITIKTKTSFEKHVYSNIYQQILTMFCKEENKNTVDSYFLNLRVFDSEQGFNEEVPIKHLVQITIDAYLKIIKSTLENEKYSAQQLQELKIYKEKSSEYLEKYLELSTAIAGSKVGAKFQGGNPSNFFEFVDNMEKRLENMKSENYIMTKTDLDSVYGTNDDSVEVDKTDEPESFHIDVHIINDLALYETITQDTYITILTDNIQFKFVNDYLGFCDFYYKRSIKSKDKFKNIVKKDENKEEYKYTVSTDPITLDIGKTKTISISSDMKVEDGDNALIMLQMNKDLRLVMDTVLKEIESTSKYYVEKLKLDPNIPISKQIISNDLNCEECKKDLERCKDELKSLKIEKDNLVNELSDQTILKEKDELQRKTESVEKELLELQLKYDILLQKEEEEVTIKNKTELPNNITEILKIYFGDIIDEKNQNISTVQQHVNTIISISDTCLTKQNEKIIFKGKNDEGLFNELIFTNIGSSIDSKDPIIMFIKSIRKLQEYFKNTENGLTINDISRNSFIDVLSQINNSGVFSIDDILHDIYKREFFVTYTAILYGNITKKFQVVVNVFNTNNTINTKNTRKWTCNKTTLNNCIDTHLDNIPYDNVYLPLESDKQYLTENEQNYNNNSQIGENEKEIYPNSLYDVAEVNSILNRFLEDTGTNNFMIFNYGFSGTGKTNMAKAFIQKLIGTENVKFEKKEYTYGMAGKLIPKKTRLNNKIITRPEFYIYKENTSDLDYTSATMTVKHRYDSNDERFKSPENTDPLDQQLLEEQPLYKTTINNEHSSRSHTVFIFKTTTEDVDNTLYFYDLAGSEDTFEMITSSIGPGYEKYLSYNEDERKKFLTQLSNSSILTRFYKTINGIRKKEVSVNDIFGSKNKNNQLILAYVGMEWLKDPTEHLPLQTVKDRFFSVLESLYITHSLKQLTDKLEVYKNDLVNTLPEIPELGIYNKIPNVSKILMIGFVRNDLGSVFEVGNKKTLDFMSSLYIKDSECTLGGSDRFSPLDHLSEMAIQRANKLSENIGHTIVTGGGIFDNSVIDTDRAVLIASSFIMCLFTVHAKRILEEKNIIIHNKYSKGVFAMLAMFSLFMFVYTSIVRLETVNIFYLVVYVLLFASVNLLLNCFQQEKISSSSIILDKLNGKEIVINTPYYNKDETNFFLTWALVSVMVIFI